MPTPPHPQLSVNPVFLHLGSLEIRYYGVLLTASFVLGYLWLKRFHSRSEITKHSGSVTDFFLATAIASLLAAKIVYSLLAWLEGNPVNCQWSIVNCLTDGGLSFHGGLLGGVLGAWLSTKRHPKFPLLKVADHLALYLPIGIILVRLGNFINQELIGPSTARPWGIIFSTLDNQPRHPTPLYEALAAVLIGLILWTVYRSETRRGWAKDGYLFVFFLLLYSLGRFSTDFFREQTVYSSLSLAQWLSLILIGLTIPFLTGRKSVSIRGEDKRSLSS